MMYQGMYAAGSAEACEFGAVHDDMQPDTAAFTSQAVTPLTDGTSRYFFAWGPRRQEHERNDQIVEGMWALAQKAFLEDKLTIEEQQRNVKLQTGAPMVSIADDRGPNMFRKVLDRLIDAEAEVR